MKPGRFLPEFEGIQQNQAGDFMVAMRLRIFTRGFVCRRHLLEVCRNLNGSTKGYMILIRIVFLKQ